MFVEERPRPTCRTVTGTMQETYRRSATILELANYKERRLPSTDAGRI